MTLTENEITLLRGLAEGLDIGIDADAFQTLQAIGFVLKPLRTFDEGPLSEFGLKWLADNPPVLVSLQVQT